MDSPGLAKRSDLGISQGRDRSLSRTAGVLSHPAFPSQRQGASNSSCTFYAIDTELPAVICNSQVWLNRISTLSLLHAGPALHLLRKAPEHARWELFFKPMALAAIAIDTEENLGGMRCDSGGWRAHAKRPVRHLVQELLGQKQLHASHLPPSGLSMSITLDEGGRSVWLGELEYTAMHLARIARAQRLPPIASFFTFTSFHAFFLPYCSTLLLVSSLAIRSSTPFSRCSLDGTVV